MKKEEALDLVKMPLCEVMALADEVRAKNRKGSISLCAIVNAKSGLCSEDCGFCAQAACHGTGIKTYPLISQGDIISKVRQGKVQGARRVGIVTSGNSPTRTEITAIASVIEKFPEEGVLPCASLGAIDTEDLRCLKSAGLKRYHHNVETSRKFYSRVVSTHTYEDRVRTITAVKREGIEICSGGILGLGETWEDRIDMAFELRSLEIDSVPLNFLMPIPGTPMGELPSLESSDALRAIALFRIILEKPCITVAAGRANVLKDSQRMIFYAGADGMMVGGYLTVPGSDPKNDKLLVEEALERWKSQQAVSI